jgi:phytoene synthase
MPFQARAGRLIIPNDIAEQTQLDANDYRALRSTPALRTATDAVVAVAFGHLAAARAHRRSIPRSALPALLPAIIAERSLSRLKRARYDPFDPAVVVSDTLQSWRLAIASLHGRF